MEYRIIKNASYTGFSRIGTLLASYNQLVELFGRSGDRHWMISTPGHRFAIWLYNEKVKDKDEILAWSIAGHGNGYEVDQCRKVTGLPCLTPPDYYQFREKYGWGDLSEAFENIKGLNYPQLISKIYEDAEVLN